MIVSYTVCVSLEENKPCIKENTTDKKTFKITNLDVSTKYYVRVLASTKVGPGQYSKYEGKFTNASKYYKLRTYIYQPKTRHFMVFFLEIDLKYQNKFFRQTN